MTPDRSGTVAKLADSVADGAPVDWPSVESSAGQGDRRLIRHLRLVDNIAALYRSIPADLDETNAETPSGQRWGRLVLLEQIGQGTSCEVYRAQDTDLYRAVALKLLHEESSDRGSAHLRLLEEARRLARVRHPNVVQVYGAERHNDRVGLWMELVDGESLDRIVQTRGRFGDREASLVGQAVCSALAAVHAAGLLHRDVKAQNVLREAGGRIVLMDFGTGEDLRPDSAKARLVGTPLYVAPEIFEAQPASVQSDLYSVGVLLFYLTTGAFPSDAVTIAQLAAAQTNGTLRRLRDVRPDLPASFVRVIDRALEHDPAARYRSAGEMEAALRDSAGSFRLTAAVASPATPTALRWSTPRPVIAALLAAMLLIVVGLVAWQRRVTPSAPTAPAFTRVAVLPLVDASPAPTLSVADALTEQLISTLGEIASLRVTQPDEVASYKGSGLGVSEIARRLAVDAVVQGTVITEPAQPNRPAHAVVHAQLLTAGGSPVWSQSFEWAAGNVQSLQAGLARAIGRGVKAAVTPAEAERLSARRHTNPAAEEAYLQGRLQLAGYGSEPAQRAVEAFERATRLDSNYAAAYAGASRAYVRLGDRGLISRADARRAGSAAARTAIRLDRDLAEARAAMADIAFFYEWDFDEAEREYLASLDLNPSFSYARLYYAELLAARGRFDEALTQAAIARELAPRSAEVKRRQAGLLFYKGDLAGAASTIEEAIQDDPYAAGAYVWKARIAEAQGQYQQALDHTDEALRLSQGRVVPLEIQRLTHLALAGRPDAARAGLAELERQAASRVIRLSARDRAYVQLALGDEAGACTLFEQAKDEGEPSLIWLSVDPRVDRLRSLPRFSALIASIGLR